jgi:hypothetical protein
MVAVPARPRPIHLLAWILPAVVVVGAWIALLWTLRPTWGYCVDGIDAAHSYCDQGVFNLGAQLGTIGLLVLLTAYVVLALALRGERRRLVLTVALVVIAIACVAAFALMFQPLEEIPMRIVDETSRPAT